MTIHLLGPFETRVNGLPLPRPRTRKGEELFALLALRAGSPVPRPWLAATLRPDSPEPAALAGFRMGLMDLRRALGEEAQRPRSLSPHSLALDRTGAWVDVRAFDAAIRAGELAALEQAVELIAARCWRAAPGAGTEAHGAGLA